MKTADAKRLDAFGREIWRRLFGLSWQDMVSNEDLESRIGGRWTFSTDLVYARKASWCGHAVRSGGLSVAVIAGLPAHTRRGPGRPRASWVNNLTQWSGLSVAELKDAGLRRIEIQNFQHSQFVEVGAYGPDNGSWCNDDDDITFLS